MGESLIALVLRTSGNVLDEHTPKFPADTPVPAALAEKSQTLAV